MTTISEYLAAQTMPPGRRKALEAAMTLFNKQGFHGTSTQQIADLAGISQATIFKYFKTKDELLDAIFDLAIELVQTDFFPRLQEQENLPDLIGFFLSDRLSFAKDNRSVIKILLQEAMVNATIQHRAQEHFPEIVEKVSQLLNRFRDSEPRLNPALSDEDILRTIISFTAGAVLQRELGGDLNVEELKKQLLRSLTTD